jgi:hypothetical protein
VVWEVVLDRVPHFEARAGVSGYWCDISLVLFVLVRFVCVASSVRLEFVLHDIPELEFHATIENCSNILLPNAPRDRQRTGQEYSVGSDMLRVQETVVTVQTVSRQRG